MRDIFISATSTGIGKTFTALMAIDILSKENLRVGVFKPIESGIKDIPNDGYLLFEKAKKVNPNLKDLTLDDIVPYQFSLPAAPYVAKGDIKISIKKLINSYQKIKDRSDIVLIEGAGGLMVPIELNLFMVDLIEIFRANTLLVVPSYLGSINETLLNIEFLKSKKLKFKWVINVQDKSFYSITKPFYDDYFKKYYTLENLKEPLISLLKN